MTLNFTFDLDLDMEQGHAQLFSEKWNMTYFYYKVKAKGHYPAKLLKHFSFLHFVFTVFMAYCKTYKAGFNMAL